MPLADALGFSAGDLSGDLYGNSVALSAVDIPGNLLYSIFANLPAFGRRRTQALFFSFGGICLLVAPVCAALGRPLSPGKLPRYRCRLGRILLKIAAISLLTGAEKGLAIAGKLAAAGVFNGVYVYAAELFPTSVRAAGLGFCNIFARVGGILAPISLRLGADTMATGLGCLSLAAGLGTLLLPETLGRALE